MMCARLWRTGCHAGRVKRLALCLGVTLVFVACSSEPVERSPRSSAPTPVEPGPEQRAATTPKGVVVENVAFGPSKRLARKAVADLKRLGYWRPLTKRLYVVRIQSRLGKIAVPDDGHLADVLLQAQVDRDRAGALCNIMFFPTAIREDLERWRDYWAAGYMEDPPPTERQFWVAILAHELAHCIVTEEKRQGVKVPVMSGEDVAERWEAKVLAQAREALKS